MEKRVTHPIYCFALQGFIFLVCPSSRVLPWAILFNSFRVFLFFIASDPGRCPVLSFPSAPIGNLESKLILKVLSERIPRSSAAGLASELKIKSYSTLKIPRSSTAGSFNSVFLTEV